MEKQPTIKLVLNRKYAHETEGYISLRISIPGTRRYKYRTTGYKIPVEYWDDENEKVLKGFPNYNIINTDIHKSKNEVEVDIIAGKLEGRVLTSEYIKKNLSGKANIDFISFFADHLEYMKTERKGKNGSRQKHSHNYVRKYEGYLERIKEFSGKHLGFSAIDVKWMQSLELHFSKTMDYETSLPVFLTKITSILRRASEQGLFDLKAIKGYQQPQYIDPDRPYLTVEETDKWAKELIYSGKLDEYPDERKVACYFLVECWGGLRFSDWHRFHVEKIHNDRALQVRAKKNGEPVYVYLHKSPRLKKLIEYIEKKKIVFDLGEKKTNTILKALALSAGIKKHITTHVGRHTCATLLLTLGYSKGKIAEWLGISEKTVDVYAKQIRIDLKHEYDKLGGI